MNIKGMCVQDGKGGYIYYDMEGNKLNEGDIIVYVETGKEMTLYRTQDGQLGTDATNPAWIANGKAVECEYGIYQLNLQDLRSAKKK